MQYVFEISLAVQDSEHLNRDRLRPVNDDIAGKFGNGPETNRQACNVQSLRSYQRMFGKTAARCDNLCFNAFAASRLSFAMNWQMESMSSTASGVS